MHIATLCCVSAYGQLKTVAASVLPGPLDLRVASCCREDGSIFCLSRSASPAFHARQCAVTPLFAAGAAPQALKKKRPAPTARTCTEKCELAAGRWPLATGYLAAAAAAAAAAATAIAVAALGATFAAALAAASAAAALS